MNQMISVLVVDDDPALRAMLTDVLTLEGYRVQTAEHGGPALDIMRASSEHLLVTLGLVMPVVNGRDVLEAVAADDALARRHAIVMVTGNAAAASEGRIKALRDHLEVPLVAKPFTMDHLLDALKEAEQRWAARFGAAPARDAQAQEQEQMTMQHDVHDEQNDEQNDDQNEQGTEEVQDAQDIQDVQHLLDRAHALMCQLKYEEALPLSQPAVELAPQSLKAWQELGSNYGDLHRVADLEQAFERALQLAKTPWDETMTWFPRGHAENNADAWKATLRSFQKMAELEPDWGVPHLFQGMVLGNMGSFIDQR